VSSKPLQDPRQITVITTHINADYDALASLLAAQRLYPDAVVVFPGSQEKNLRNFFVDSMAYLFNMADIRQIDLSQVTRLVLVDTRQKNRIGKLAELIDRPGLEVHVYDHHPGHPQDVGGTLVVQRPTGATVTILTGLIREKGVQISADEATLMCLGIYEDTGSFTFASTTEEDFLAAAFLLSKGANLNIIANLISREIGTQQVGLLNDMIQGASRYVMAGADIMVTKVSTEAYVPDFAFLVHKMMRMENVDALFALAAMGSKVYLVARSRVAEVDVGALGGEMGGGGHALAAAATLRDTTLTQAEHQLVDLIRSRVRSRQRAKDLMSSPPIMVDQTVVCQDAAAILTRYNINALLVTGQQNGGSLLMGFITRQVIEKALFHQLHHVPVKEYMSTEIATVEPDAELAEIQEKIIESKQRVLPVVDKTGVKGVITRTDLFNILVRRGKIAGTAMPNPYREAVAARTRNVIKFMQERLSQRVRDLLQSIGQIADELGCQSYVVGGFVRDLFLYRPNEDLDVVIEGDGIAFARRYAALKGVRVHTHEKFGTAVIIYPDGFKVDVASARMEYYNFPAALPTVEMSSIKLDLFRRDFTINTLAIQLNSRRFGTLIDFFAAQRDIKEKIIRVLHNLSFVEDPTRVFRAIRFEQRFGFVIGKLTAGLIENAVKMDFFKRLSGRRVFSELRQILEEESPALAIIRLNDFNLLHVVHPSIQLTKERLAAFHAAKNVLSWYGLLFLDDSYMKWPVYFMVLIRSCDRRTVDEICRRFELAPWQRQLCGRQRCEAERQLKWLERRDAVANSVLYHRLKRFKTEHLLFMMAVTDHEPVKRAISAYCTRLRYVKPLISGKDLKRMGLAPGPVYHEILDALLNAKLDAKVDTMDDELAFVRRWRAQKEKKERFCAGRGD
jgi:tRNA nucleotidyltransferase (CCA-adding enzyme)